MKDLDLEYKIIGKGKSILVIEIARDNKVAEGR